MPTAPRLFELLDEAQRTTQQLANSFQLGNVIKNGVSVAIIGRPNAGKSTLLNTLLNENRAIVSEIAGTTRDTIEEVLNIDGILFRLIDTAGIREHTHDVIESIGMEKALAKMQQADVVIYLFDVNEIAVQELQTTVNELNSKKVKYILVGNKADVSPEAALREKFSTIPGIIFISAKANQHTEVLKKS